MRFSTLTALVVSLVTVASSFAFASGELKLEEKKLEPASRYSGSSPIDLSNGLPGNNGTFGLPNEAYEKWATEKKIVPGINDAAYRYEQKSSLVQNLDEQIMWGETAIANWKSNPSNKPEVSAYAKQAVETMSPALDKLKDATKTVKSAGSGDWASAEEGARKALAEFRATYRGLHKNTATR